MIQSRFGIRGGRMACMIAILFLAFSAEARNAYVETHWEPGFAATSQTIKLMNGSAQVGTVTANPKGVGDTGSSVATGVIPVYPAGGYSTSDRRDFGCKAVRDLARGSDEIYVQGTGWKKWNQDLPAGAQVDSWDGYKMAPLSDDAVIYCKGANVDPIFDVNNYRYDIRGWSGTYDGNLHYITVGVGTSGCTVEYSSDNATWSSSNVGHRDQGSHTVYYRISKDGQTPETGSAIVAITAAQIAYRASDVEKWYDGNPASISLSVSSPADCTVEYSRTGTDGWESENPSYTDVGVYTTYFRISKPNYATVTGSRTVTINEFSDLVYTVSGYDGIYDGDYHGISVAVTTPARAQVTYSYRGEGPYSGSDYNSYRDVGTYTVYYQIAADGYRTVRGAATVVIREKQIAGPDIVDSGHTNFVYSGRPPWDDTPGYTVGYDASFSNSWGVGWWWAEFRGRGNYTGAYTNWFRVTPRSASIVSGSASTYYTGSPLTCNTVTPSGFLAGEGLLSWTTTGSQTEIGSSPNTFTYELTSNTRRENYNLSVVNGRLSVYAITPVSMKYPVRIEILGTNRLEVGVPSDYRYRVTFSDGTTQTSVSSPYPGWSLSPGMPKVRMASNGSHERRLTAYPVGAGSEHRLTVAYTNSYSTAAAITNGLVAWYPFDGSSLADVSVYNQSASASGTSWVSDRTDTSNRAIRFSGSSASYVCATSPTAILTATNALSVSAWIKPEDGAAMGLLRREGQFSLQIMPTGEWLFNGVSIEQDKSIEIGQWQFVTLAWDGSVARTYVNGIQTGRAELKGPLAPGSGPFYLGQAKEGSSPTFFKGAVDDVRLFDRALTDLEIARIKTGTDVSYVASTVGVSAFKDLAVEPRCRLPVALDVEKPSGEVIGKTSFAFTTGNSAPDGEGWYGQYADFAPVKPADDFDYDAVRSGRTTGDGTAWIETEVSGAGELSFWWKSDCEPTYDYLVFRDNDRELARLSGSNDWRQIRFRLEGDDHRLRWEYVKDGAGTVGADAVWVDRLEWMSLDVPKRPSGVSLVDASDGHYDGYVYVTWGEPNSAWPISAYRVWRKISGELDTKYVQISPDLTARAFTDVEAEPGVAYVYKVEARNSQGWGNCGTDDGYRGVILGIDPEAHHFSNVPTGEAVAVTVVSNALWKAVPDESWIEVRTEGGRFVVTAKVNDSAVRRSGTVTVTCGLDAAGNPLAHRKVASFAVTQSASVNIGFTSPYADWRTELQLTTTNDVSGYAPVSVFPVGADVKISFGWELSDDIDVELPAVRFKVYTASHYETLSWTDRGMSTSGKSLPVLDKYGRKVYRTACGFWNADNLKTLPPGDYQLEAELDPEDLLDDPNRDNNKAFFRFAVRDPLLAFGKDVFFADCWTNLVVSNGNDYAQAPHVARRTVEIVADSVPYVYETAAVQFGPYVPMDGVNGRKIEKKKPVDIVFLIDYTGSMDACIAGLMNNIGSFIDRLMIGDADHGISPIEDLRIKIVGFSDYQSDCGYKNWMQEYAFTTDRKLLKQQLNELKNQCYGGGGNGGESSYDALYYICKDEGWSTVWDGKSKPTTHVSTASPFRPLEEAARAVVLFTDEPPHVPLDAPGCKGVELDGLDAVIKAAGVHLTIIGDGRYYRNYSAYEKNIHWLDDLVCLDRGRRKLQETKPRTLADFTQNTSDLQALAKTIVLQTPTVATVVEPSFSAAAHGEGTLTFRWCNDSTSAGTNNTFTFIGEGMTNIVRYGEERPAWRDEKVVFDYDGLHPLKWTYRKLGYEGSVVDCGLVADVRWTRRATELEVTPPMAEIDALGTNKVQMATNVVDGVPVPCKAFGATFDVKCNSIWKVVTNDAPGWIRFVQDSGNGDGSIVIAVDANPSLEQRVCVFTVRAGEYGTPDDDIVERTVTVVQDAAEPVPTDRPQILTVDVKPRWPWNEFVDIDFKILLPIGEEGKPVRIDLRGVNYEGGSFAEQMKGTLGANRYVSPSSAYVSGNEVEPGEVYAVCQTSGWYRVTWRPNRDINAVLSAVWTAELDVHLSSFAVEVSAQRLNGDGSDKDARESAPIRLDARYSGNGVSLVSGKVRIGHPTGGSFPDAPIDPVWVDTTELSNGWNHCSSFFRYFLEDHPPECTNAFYAGGDTMLNDRVCVINRDDVVFEGGEITNDTVWAADKIHLIRDNVYVATNATLTIENGARMKFCSLTRLFAFRDDGEEAHTAEWYNIRMKGAWGLNALDSSDGDDTLCGLPEGYPCMGMDYNYIVNQDIDRIESDNDGTPVLMLELQVPKTQKEIAAERADDGEYDESEDAGVQYKRYQHRYYTIDEKLGDVPIPTMEGKRFYGWYNTQDVPRSGAAYIDPHSQRYELMHHDDVVSYSSAAYAELGDYDVKKYMNYGYALFRGDDDDGGAWKDIEPIVEKKNAGEAVLTLSSDSSVVYDGTLHRPSIEPVRIGSETLVCAPDYGDYPEGFRTAGVYGVSAKLPDSYTNAPSARFEILPRPVEDGETVLTPTSSLYVPNAEGGVSLPSVKVFLSLKDGADPVEIPYAHTNWYDLKKDATHYWPRPGKYHVEVKFDANYSGTLTNEFAIEKNPEYDFTSGRYAKSTAEEAAEAAKASGKRILYFAGEVPEDAATAYVKSLITDDIDTNEWTIAKFVCWTDRADSAAFARYSAGLDEVACPLICVLNPNDLETPIVRTCGYQTKEQLMGFLAASLTAPVDASAATVAFRTGKGAFTYNDKVQKPEPGDLCITYAGAELSASTYDLVFENAASEDVGTYDVWARLKPNTWVGGYLVTGETAVVSYTIGAQAVWDGMDPVIRARLGIGLKPPAAVYNGSVQRPTVTSVVAYASVDYGTNDWFNIGTHTLRVTFSSNYCGTVSERFAIAAQEVVSPTVVLDRLEEYVSSKSTTSLRPNVLRVYDASRTYVENADYAVDYGTGNYTSPGTNTITVTFCGNYSGEVRVNFIIRAVDGVVDTPEKPEIKDDPAAVVTGDAEKGFVVTPSAGKNEVTVTIPTGVSPSKVTVRLSPTVRVAKPSGATMRIVRGEYSYDIRENLNFTTNAEDGVDLENATVKEEVVREMFDARKGGAVHLDPSNPSLSVVTREGLLYSFREGATLEALKADASETHVGDGKPWTNMTISVKGGRSGFYGVGVEK